MPGDEEENNPGSDGPGSHDEGETVVHAEEHTFVHQSDEPAAPEVKEDYSDQARLEIFSGRRSGEVFPLNLQEGQTYVIGRGPDYQLVLDDGSVSRRHAEITKQGGIHYISDLGSSNGTLVDDQLISRFHPLKNDAEIKIGIYQLIFNDPQLKEELIANLPVPYDASNASTPLPSEFQEPKENASSLRGPNWGNFLIGLAIISFILLVGVNRIVEEENFRIGEVWKALFGTPSGPTLSYPLLEIRTEPLSGKIFFQDEFIGSSPLEIKLEKGVQPQVEFELRAEFELEDIEEKVEVKEMATFSLDQEVASFFLEAPIGQIHVKKIPTSTRVWLEYSRVPTEEEILENPEARPKPIIRQPEIDYKNPINVPFGKYIFELRREEEFVYRRHLEVNDAQPHWVFEITDEDLTFTPLFIVTEPPGALVYLNDKILTNKTPVKSFKLPFGQHTIVLRKENFQDYILKELPEIIEINEPLEFKIELPISPVGEMIVAAKKEYDLGKYKAMEKTLYQALKSNPSGLEKAEIQLLLGDAYLKQKNYRQALIYFRKSERFKGKEGENPFSEKSRLGQARVYLSQGKEKQAIQLSIEVFFKSEDRVIKTIAEEIYKKISPLESVIHVESMPPGARIFLNGENLKFSDGTNAVTPMNIPGLRGGSYNILFVKEGFQDQEERVVVSFGELKALPRVKMKPL